MDGPHHKQNFLYECFDDITKVLKKYDVSYSLGDGLRPGVSLTPATKRSSPNCAPWASDHEGLGARCASNDRRAGPRSLDKIKEQVDKEVEWCHSAPFYTLGPLVTDIAPGYDHITSAIGAAMIGWHGAAMLCTSRPKTLGLPNEKDVKDGIIAYKIAAHAADVARHRPERVIAMTP